MYYIHKHTAHVENDMQLTVMTKKQITQHRCYQQKLSNKKKQQRKKNTNQQINKHGNTPHKSHLTRSTCHWDHAYPPQYVPISS